VEFDFLAVEGHFVEEKPKMNVKLISDVFSCLLNSTVTMIEL